MSLKTRRYNPSLTQKRASDTIASRSGLILGIIPVRFASTKQPIEPMKGMLWNLATVRPAISSSSNNSAFCSSASVITSASPRSRSIFNELHSARSLILITSIKSARFNSFARGYRFPFTSSYVSTAFGITSIPKSCSRTSRR